MKHLHFLQMQGMTDTSSEVASDVTKVMGDLGITGMAAGIIGGIAILVVGFFLAKLLARVTRKLIKKTGIDDKVKSSTNISSFFGKLVYFLIMIIVLMAALNVMGVGNEVLAPLNEMMQKIGSAIPNILVAGIIIYIGYFLAKIISELVEFAGDTIESFAPKLNMPEGMDLVKILKTIVFIIVFIPILIVGLDFLQFDAITEPATSMLEQFMASIPLIIKATAIILIAVFGGRLVTNLLKELFSNLKVDSLTHKLGLDNVLGSTSLSGLISKLVYIVILYLGIMQALDVLNLDQLAVVLNDVLYVAGKVFLGLLIVVLGNVVANFAVRIFSKGEDTNNFTLLIMRGAIIAIFLAM